MSIGERKLFVMLLGCLDLPPQLSSETNNTFITMRLVEKSYTNAVDSNDLTQGRLISLVRSGDTKSIIAAVEEQNVKDAIDFYSKKQRLFDELGDGGESVSYASPYAYPQPSAFPRVELRDFMKELTSAVGAMHSTVDGSCSATTTSSVTAINTNNIRVKSDSTALHGGLHDESEHSHTSYYQGGEHSARLPLKRKETAADLGTKMGTGGYGADQLPPFPSSEVASGGGGGGGESLHHRDAYGHASRTTAVGDADVTSSSSSRKCPIPLGPLYRIERTLGNATVSSPIVRYTSNPTWEEIFIFEDLAIPHYYSYASSENTIEKRMAAAAAKALAFASHNKPNIITITSYGTADDHNTITTTGSGLPNHHNNNNNGNETTDTLFTARGEATVTASAKGATDRTGGGALNVHSNTCSDVIGGPSRTRMASLVGAGSSASSSSPVMGGSALPTGRPSPQAFEATSAAGPQQVRDAFGESQNYYGSSTLAGGARASDASAPAAAVVVGRGKYPYYPLLPNDFQGMDNLGSAAVVSGGGQGGVDGGAVATEEGPVGAGSFGGSLRLTPAYDNFGKKLKMPSEFMRRTTRKTLLLAEAAKSGIKKGGHLSGMGSTNRANNTVDTLRSSGGYPRPHHHGDDQEGASPLEGDAEGFFKDLLTARHAEEDDTLHHDDITAADSNTHRSGRNGATAVHEGKAGNKDRYYNPSLAATIGSNGTNVTVDHYANCLSPAEEEAELLNTLENALLLERQYFLELEARDVTLTSGMGDLIASFSIQVDLLPMTRQTEVWSEMAVNFANTTLKLPIRNQASHSDSNSSNPSSPYMQYTSRQQEKRQPLPQIGVVIEPVNFGSVPVPQPSSPTADLGTNVPIVGVSTPTDIGIFVPADQRQGNAQSNSNPRQVPLPRLRGGRLVSSPLTANLRQHRHILRRKLQASGAIPLERDEDDENDGFGVIRDPVDLILAKRGLGAGRAGGGSPLSSTLTSDPSKRTANPAGSDGALTHTLSLLTDEERMELMLQTSISPNARALAHLVMEELQDTFVFEFISEVISILLYVDEETNLAGLGKEEMHTLMQELYTFTGTPLPTDANLAEQLRYLFNTFDRDHDELLTVQEICNVLRSSQFRVNLSHRWKVGHTYGGAGAGGPSQRAPAGAGATAAATLRNSAARGNGGGGHRFPSIVSSSTEQAAALAISTPVAGAKESDHSLLSPISTFNKATTTTAGSLGDPRNVVSAATVAGCLWSEAVPAPFSYAGFRLPNGRAHDGSLKPSIVSDRYNKLTPYQPAAYRDLHDELYGDTYKPHRAEDGSLRFPTSPSSSPHSSPRQITYREEDKGGNGNDDAERARAQERLERQTIPLFERNRPLHAPAKVPKTHTQRQIEREQLELLFSSHKVRKHPTDKTLPHTAGERLSHVAIEGSSLNACIVDDSLLVGCRIESGTYTNCTFEACLIINGATIISPVGGVRSCSIENSKVWTASLFNCKLTRSRIEDCKYVAQCSLKSCTMRSVSIYHCFVSDVSLDPTISDGGANIIEGCRVEDIPKLTYAERLLDL